MRIAAIFASCVSCSRSVLLVTSRCFSKATTLSLGIVYNAPSRSRFATRSIRPKRSQRQSSDAFTSAGKTSASAAEFSVFAATVLLAGTGATSRGFAASRYQSETSISVMPASTPDTSAIRCRNFGGDIGGIIGTSIFGAATATSAAAASIGCAAATICAAASTDAASAAISPTQR